MKTEDYKELQQKAMKQCDDQLEEIGKRFANNERVRIKREDMVIAQTEDIIEAAKSFIAALKEDISTINKNITIRVDKAQSKADEILGQMGQKILIEQTFDRPSLDTKKDY